ncbi:hypothetical protein DYB25_007662 [Aphanomyces astaci]|uniref:Uncharacterized protein n=1 Tax=Aphanomyces astaci TaxID=112090 RepID=A0A396ZP93_APHAT|nr:hypothetical protein DYB25_007662 [Aphanomyces astaci]
MQGKNELKAKATGKPASVNSNVMEATPMEPNDMAQSGATMERIKVSTKGKAKSTTTASTKGKAKLKAPPRITATVQHLPTTAADGEQFLPDAWSEAQRELLQRIQLAYPSDLEDETKDDPDVANHLIQTYISMYGIGGIEPYSSRLVPSTQPTAGKELYQVRKRLASALDTGTTSAKRAKTQLVSNATYRGEDKESVLNRQRNRREQLRIAKAKLAVKAAKMKEARQRAKKTQMRSAEEEPHVEDFLMEFVPTEPPIIPEGPALGREEMAVLDVQLNPRPFQPLDDPEALQDDIDFVEGVLDDIGLDLTLEPYPFQPLEDPTVIHGEVQFIEDALQDIDLGEDPPFLPQDPVQDAIRPPRRNPNLPCCSKSKVKMDPYVFPDSPEMQAFKDLFRQRNFIEHIRQYNAQFNFSSIGTNEVKHSGSGPKTYCIQGQLTLNIGPLQPSLNRSGNLRQPSFAQIYMHSSEEQLKHVSSFHQKNFCVERKRTGHRGAIFTPSDERLAYQKCRADSGDSFDRTSAKLALANAASICI